MAFHKKITVLLCLLSLSAFAEMRSFKPPFHIKWVTKLKKERLVTKRPFQFAVPVIDGETLYVGAVSGHLYALTANKGKKLWHIKLSGGFLSQGAVDGEFLYIADIKGNIYAINKLSGKVKWQAEAGAEISSRPLVLKDTVYVVTALRQLIALDKENGGRKWYTLKEGLMPGMTVKGSSNPIFYEGRIFVGFADGTFAAYDPSNGEILWKMELSDRSARFQDIDSEPLVFNGMIYVSTAGGETFAINPKDGGIIWRIAKGSVNDPISDGVNIYIAGNGVLSAVSKDTGQILWEQDFEEPEISTPAVQDGVIVVASTKDKLYTIDSATGELKYKRYLGKGSFGKPVIQDGLIYILTNSSRMFALKGD